MITEKKLNEGQTQGLVYALEALYDGENISNTGMEVLWVQKEDQYYKVMFSYEDRQDKMRYGKLYFTGAFSDDGFTDFKEHF